MRVPAYAKLCAHHTQPTEEVLTSPHKLSYENQYGLANIET